MKAPTFLLSVSMAAALLGGSGLRAAENPPAEGAAKAAPQEARPTKTADGWPVLRKGATEEEIVKIVGQPDAVRPMATTDGKAEVWIYRRLAKEMTRQSAVTTDNVMAFSGVGTGNDAFVSTPVASYRIEHIKIYQVSSLLLFDGQLVTATQKAETERKFEN